MAYHPSFQKYMQQVGGYIENLCQFLKQYCKERYGMDLEVYAIWPGDFVPKTYAELKDWDVKSWPRYFGNELQFYIMYDLDLIPRPDLNENAIGYTEACCGAGIRQEDFCYVEMAAYYPSAFLKSIYQYYEPLARDMTHELDHRILALENNPRWVSAVHKAQRLPLIRWEMGDGKYFVSQRDARSV